MLNFSTTILMLFFGIFTLTASEINELRNPPAPFAANKIIQTIPKVKIWKKSNAKNYAILCGDNKLQFRLDNPMIQYLTTSGQANPIAAISFWGQTKFGFGRPFKGEKTEINYNKTSNSIVVTKRFYGASGKYLDGLFTEKLTIEKDGLINFNYSYVVPHEAKITDKGLFFRFRPYHIIAGMKLLIDGKPYQFSADGPPYGHRLVFSGKASEVIFAPDKPTQSFRLIFPKPTKLYIKEKKKEEDKGNIWKYFVQMRIYPPRNESISFKLDIKSAKAPK